MFKIEKYSKELSNLYQVALFILVAQKSRALKELLLQLSFGCLLPHRNWCFRVITLSHTLDVEMENYW